MSVDENHRHEFEHAHLLDENPHIHWLDEQIDHEHDGHAHQHRRAPVASAKQRVTDGVHVHALEHRHAVEAREHELLEEVEHEHAELSERHSHGLRSRPRLIHTTASHEE